MPSLKAIRKRISSVKNTQKITKAMKMVALAKLRRAQDAVQALRPYAQQLGQIASDVAERIMAEPESPAETTSAGGQTAEAPPGENSQGHEEQARLIRKILAGQSEARVRILVVSADRGLAGAYNSNLFRRVERFAVEESGKQFDLFVLGKKGRDYFRRRPFKVVKDLPGVDSKTAAERAREVAAIFGEMLRDGQTDAIYVVYNEFKNVSSQVVKMERLLPIRVANGAADASADEPRSLLDFEYEPGREEVLSHLLPLYLEAELHRIFLEAIASEFGARMRAMDSASRSAKEMIARLTLQYNRARQAAITKELMEIIGGAEALKG
jgi:F-type H+-transporting ATPase subunit gamma